MSALPNDTTKPSRINRKRKKSWKIGAGLTGYSMAAILYPVLQQQGRAAIPNNIGHKRPLSTVVFLYPPKTQVVDKAVADEREKCAWLCEKLDNHPDHLHPGDCAEAIRMRSNAELRGASRDSGEASP